MWHDKGSPYCNNTLLWVPALFQYFHSKFSQDIVSVAAQGKSLHYGLKLSDFC